jgi:archaemetzincin
MRVAVASPRPSRLPWTARSGALLALAAACSSGGAPGSHVGAADRPAVVAAASVPESAGAREAEDAVPPAPADAAAPGVAVAEPDVVEPETAAPPCSHVPGVCCVALQPLGRVPQEDVAAAAGALGDLYGFEVRVLDPVELPRSAWYEPRQRWRAEKLNDFLRDRVPEGCDKIAGLTTQDISTTKGDIEDWGILGLADMPGTAAVFSTFRCRRRVHDVPALERLRRVAVHEVGHTLGLPHCPTYGCFLEDAGGKAETIDRETFLCDVCRERLGWVE